MSRRRRSYVMASPTSSESAQRQGNPAGHQVPDQHGLVQGHQGEHGPADHDRRLPTADRAAEYHGETAQTEQQPPPPGRRLSREGLGERGHGGEAGQERGRQGRTVGDPAAQPRTRAQGGPPGQQRDRRERQGVRLDRPPRRGRRAATTTPAPPRPRRRRRAPVGPPVRLTGRWPGPRRRCPTPCRRPRPGRRCSAKNSARIAARWAPACTVTASAVRRARSAVPTANASPATPITMKAMVLRSEVGRQPGRHGGGHRRRHRGPPAHDPPGQAHAEPGDHRRGGHCGSEAGQCGPLGRERPGEPGAEVEHALGDRDRGAHLARRRDGHHGRQQQTEQQRGRRHDRPRRLRRPSARPGRPTARRPRARPRSTAGAGAPRRP